jgi:DNA-binding SARP family transcriptional activator
MDFRILGPLEVEDDGRVLPLGGSKQRALLAILLLHANETVSRDRLIEGLWGERPPNTAATALQVHVSGLRKALEPGRAGGEPQVVLTRPPGYLIRLDPDQLDLNRFDRLVGEGKRALADGDAETASSRLRDALALWRGTPLAEFDSASFAQTESLRLEELRLAALEEQTEADLALGRHTDLTAELERLVGANPLRERLRAQLMLALYRCGRQAAALETYQAGRRRLSEELGLEPGEGLQRLERAILNHDPSLNLAPPQPAPVEPSVPTGTVTFVFTDIEGSTALVKRLGDRYGELLEQHHRFLRSAFDAAGGHEIDTQGDAFFFTFRRARDAVRAAVEAQRVFAAESWPDDAEVQIRIGIHTGEPGLAGADYHGLDVVRAARISGAAFGGQILVSSATRDLVGDALPGISFLDLGEHGLREIDRPERIFQVVAPELREDFPRPRTGDGARVMSIGGREEELAAAAEAVVEEERRRARLRGRTRMLAVLGALLLGAAITAAVVELLRGSSRAVVAVAPNSVAVIDSKTNRVVGDVPVGARPVAVAAGAGGIWVANADDGTVSRIDPKTRRVESVIGIGTDVSDVAVGFGSIWVANGNDGTLAQIDPSLNTVERTLTFGGGSELAPQPVFSVTTGAGAVWVTRGNRVLRIDPKTDEVAASIPVEPPLGIAAGEGAVWVTTTADHLLRIEPSTGAVTAKVPLPGQAIAPDAAGGSVWLIVTFPGHDEVWQLNPSTSSPTGTAPSSSHLSGIAWSPEAVWAAERKGSVLRIDPKTHQATTRIHFGQRPTAVAVADGSIWISVESAT